MTIPQFLNYGRGLLKIAMVGWLAWLMFPSPWNVFSIGLDGSYGWGINAAHQLGLQYGRDIVFTYGPLGYLLWPLPWGTIPAASLTFHLVILATWIGLLLYLAFTRLSLIRLFLFAACFAFLRSDAEMQVLALVLICTAVVVTGDRLALLFCAIASLFATLILFAKFSSGVAVCGVVAVMLLILLIKERHRFGASLMACAGGSLVVALPVAIIHFDGIRSIITWVRASLALSEGYATAMSLIGSLVVLKIAIVLLISVTTVFLISRKAAKDRFLSLLCIAPLFVFFKHGFVRQDTHVLFFFSAFLVVVTALFLVAHQRRLLIGFAILYLAGAAVYVNIARVEAPWYLPSRSKFIGYDALKAARKAAQLEQMVQNLASRSERGLAPDRLPPVFVSSVRAQHLSVDIVPWETSMIPANDFIWKPSPVFQFYTAYTAYLDNLNAVHYEGDQAADRLVVHFGELDGRNMMWDTPQTWRSILAHYEFDCALPSNQVIVLRRTQGKGKRQRQEIARGEFRVNTWQDVPKTDHLLYAEVVFPWSLAGRIRKTLFRIPPIYMDTREEGGAIKTWRIVPDVLQGGIMINTVPATLGDFERLVRGVAGPRIVAIKIHGDGAAAFAKPLSVVWKAAPGMIAFPPVDKFPAGL